MSGYAPHACMFEGVGRARRVAVRGLHRRAPCARDAVQVGVALWWWVGSVFVAIHAALLRRVGALTPTASAALITFDVTSLLVAWCCAPFAEGGSGRRRLVLWMQGGQMVISFSLAWGLREQRAKRC